MRPDEHDGKTYYCVSGCVDGGDNLYFTPGEKPPESKLVVRENATPIISTEPPGMNDGDVMVWKQPVAPPVVEVETEAIGEGEQQALIETGEKWEEHWGGMPEFKQEDLQPYKTIYVHFESREDMEKFAKLVKQKVGLNTRSIWYPEAEIGRIATKEYIKDESATR